MTANEPAGQGMMRELDREECLSLIRSKHVGRIAWCGVRGPQVLPVNYVVTDDDAVLFRTSPHSQIAKALYETQAAFQVDDADEFLQAGWSVLIVGTATYLRDPNDIPTDLDDRPTPWAGGVRTMYIRVSPDVITGRRVVAA
jgi:nitroimidazol reductase NimA-like FMN-containing flavoprotein (pyridoxamine 5'-phosphate oxidase superfamily)